MYGGRARLGAGVTDVAMSNSGGGSAGGGCAVVSGGVRCWGQNTGGRLGDGTTTARSTPVAPPGLGSGVTKVSVHASRACAIQNGGSKRWGGGDLGAGDGNSSLTPVVPAGLASGVQDVAVGWRHICAIQDGVVKCWGDNTNGQLGYTGPYSTPYRYVPRPITGVGTDQTPMTFPPFVEISAGGDVNCAITQGGAVWCWGFGSHGRLGNGQTGNTIVPQQVAGLDSGVTDISINWEHGCAVRGGRVLCWGDNHYGQLGNGVPWQPAGQTSSVPVAVVGLTGVTSIATAGSHTCAMAGGRQAWCWGHNQHGKLGNEAAGSGSTVPVPVVGRSPAPTPTPPTPTPADTTKPSPSKVSLSKRAFRATISEAARLTITVSRRRAGRRQGTRCVKPSPNLRRARQCVRLKRIGALTAAGNAGANDIAFKNRIGRKKLKPGSDRAVLVARDAAGNLSSAKTVRFTVKRPKRR